MPELPEVETVRRQLEEIIPKTSNIVAVYLSHFKLRKPLSPALKKGLIGQHFVEAKRSGKTLFLNFNKSCLENHLGMSGWWRSQQGKEDWQSELQKHDHFALIFENGSMIVYNDARRFGWVTGVLPGEQNRSKGLAHSEGGAFPVDPTQREVPFEELWSLCRCRAVPIKNLLMSQAIILGVGNIYASEILFRAGVRPTKPANKVTKRELKAILKAMNEIFDEAIRSGGSTIRSYKSVDGVAGGFQTFHQVYDFEGEPCRRCGYPIRMKVMSGRSTYWCPECQK